MFRAEPLPSVDHHFSTYTFVWSFLCPHCLHSSRRPANYDTSDSEGGKHALSPAQRYARRAVPTLVEPADMDDHADSFPGFSRSPSPGPTMSPSLAHQSMRLHNSDSDAGWDRSPALPSRRRSVATTVRSAASNQNTMSPGAWGPRRIAMLRTASDGADVIADPNGIEWAVANGHGTGKRLDGSVDSESVEAVPVADGVAARSKTLRRSQSLQADRRVYRSRHVNEPAHLAIDVAMCEVVWALRKRERMLAKRTADMAVSCMGPSELTPGSRTLGVYRDADYIRHGPCAARTHRGARARGGPSAREARIRVRQRR